MAAKAIVVGGQTVYEAELCGSKAYCNGNPDGYLIFPIGFSAQTGFVRIIANGMKPALYPVSLDGNNQEIHFGVPGGQPNTIHFPALSFEKPSRDRIINVMANLCNLIDAQDCPIFEPFINQLILTDKNRADEWVAQLKDNGSTHITTDLTGDYNEYLSWANGRYPIPGGDYTNNLDDFKRILDYLLGANLIPIVKSGADGQNFDPVGLTYGWQWGMDNLPRIYAALVDYHDQCLWSTGYDGCFPDWSPDQLLQFLRMMRASLDDNCIDTEFGAGGGSISYIHLGQGAANWVPDQLGMLDTFSLELQTFPMEDEGLIEVYQRLLDESSPVYYRHNVNKVQCISMYETTAYWSIRKYCSVNDNQLQAHNIKSFGYNSFGNGVPNA